MWWSLHPHLLEDKPTTCIWATSWGLFLITHSASLLCFPDFLALSQNFKKLVIVVTSKEESHLDSQMSLTEKMTLSASNFSKIISTNPKGKVSLSLLLCKSLISVTLWLGKAPTLKKLRKSTNWAKKENVSENSCRLLWPKRSETLWRPKQRQRLPRRPENWQSLRRRLVKGLG